MKVRMIGVLAGAIFAFSWVTEAAPDQSLGATAFPAATIAKSAPMDSGAPAVLPSAKSQNSAQPAEALSPAIQDILKLADAGVSPNVLKGYAESTRFAVPLTAAEVLALKQHSVPDEVTTILLKRSAAKESQTQAQPAPSANATVAAPGPAPAYLDPEGYNYFQYYYLQPRALASAQETLGWYPYGYRYMYPFGYNEPFPFGGYSYGPGFGGFGHHPYAHGTFRGGFHGSPRGWGYNGRR